MSRSLPAFDNVWTPLETLSEIRTSIVVSELTAAVGAPFDYPAPAELTFTPWRKPEDLPDGIGVIVGASGSGKSTLLREFGQPHAHRWALDTPICDHFPDASTARDCFYAAGLSSVPTWHKPYRVLSNGERFRADLARALTAEPTIVDEFTSVVDRTVALASSRSLRRHINRRGGSATLATCHRDVLPWLQPDWVIDTDAGEYIIHPKECLQPPELVVEVWEIDRAMWAHFMGHHYLVDTLHPFARCYLATVDSTPAAFGAAIPFPNGNIKNAWRGTRTVTLPDYQGLGVGMRLSDWIAEAHRRAGYRYFSRTTHPRMAAYRNANPCWRETASSGKRQRPAAGDGWGRFGVDACRIAYSHEWVGAEELA